MATATACTSLTGIDDLSVGDEPQPPEAGTVPISDGGSGRIEDAPIAVRDAAPDGDIAPPPRVPFCSTIDATLCEAFDGPPSTTVLQPYSYGVDGSSEVLDDASSSSPPNSLRFDIVALDAGAAGGVFRYVVLPNDARTMTSLSFEANVRLEQSPSTEYAFLVGIGVRNAAASTSIGLFTSKGNDAVEEGYRPQSGARATRYYDLPMKLPRSVWTRLRVDLARAGGEWQASVAVDGAELLSRRPVGYVLTDGGAPFVDFGLNYVSGPSPAVRLYVDDVVIDAR